MNDGKVIKVNYFKISDFCTWSDESAFNTKIDFDKVKKYSSLIPWRFERSKSYVEDIDRLRCILSGILIYKSFGDVCKEVLYNKLNKPYFDNSDWNFNISHSGDYVVFVRDTEKIGIDIERIKKENLDIIDHPFSDKEKEFIDNDIEKLTRLWTIKESVFKASGIEEAIEYRDIDVVDTLNNKQVCLFGTKYNIISEKVDDYYLSVASLKEYERIALIKENL